MQQSQNGEDIEAWSWDSLRVPPVSHRAVPLWSWNDQLDGDELERQIEEMHRVGIGGFFMHARGGLKTPYMEEEWMKAIDICIRKARSLGMEPWFYDENGWPSGFGGGSVPALGVSYQQKKLAVERYPFSANGENTLAYYAKTAQGYRRLNTDSEEDVPGLSRNGADSSQQKIDSSGKPAHPHEAELRIYWQVNPYYIDTLSHTAVRAFIEGTYEAYWKRFGEEFQSILKGIFTDEPQFARGGLPWSFELEATYLAKHGCDLLEELPALFEETVGCREARYRYWSCVTEMFVNAYAKQIGDWCTERGWSATGHVVDEQTLMGQTTSVGDPLAFYEYLQIPGCDWLGRFVDDEPLVPKQVGSVARQLGKKRTITESYGCSGWNVSFQDLKRIGEWQFVHGINMMCPHLQSYSLKGLRKRDYPPSLFYQQPWWPDYGRFTDYFARLSMLLSEGERQADILLLHPVRTAWVEQVGFDSTAIKPYHEQFAELSRSLCRAFLEHDYGSESIIERHAKIADGCFVVGQATYSAIVVPPSVTWSEATIELLLAFQEQGGSVTMLAPYPTLVNGKPDDRLERLLAGSNRPDWQEETLVATISHASQPYVRIQDGNGASLNTDKVNVQTMRLDDSWLYYIVHSGENALGTVSIELNGEARVTLLNLETGEEEPLHQELRNGAVRIDLPMPAAQSYMLKRKHEASSVPIEMLKERIIQPLKSIKLDAPWRVKACDLNSLTLDSCRISIEGGEWSDEQPILFLQQRLLEWGRPVRIACEFRFSVAFDISLARELFLVMEQPDRASITLNGHLVELRELGWWLDTSFRKVDISGLCVYGENSLVIESEFYNSAETYAAIERAKLFESEGNKLTFDSELESVYLLGSFSVSSLTPYREVERRALQTEGPFVLAEPLSEVLPANLTGQGLPFFAGIIGLEQSFTLEEAWLSSVTGIRLRFDSPPDAIVTRLWVNGKEVRTFVWEPFEADITTYLRPGRNVLELAFTGSCRNVLGPHHHIKGELYKVGPDSFTNKAGWTDKDLPANTNVYQDSYTLVNFGFSEASRIEWF